MKIEEFERLKKIIKDIPEEKLIDTFSKGALKLNDDQIKTVSFAFWLCYMAETDLNSIIHQAWQMAQQVTRFPNQEEVNKVIKNMGFNFDNLEYFGQKIDLYQKMFGKTERTKLLWKINTIRNDLSHNRIDNLNYNGESLTSREAKEKIVIDYFETSFSADFSKSKVWNDLTPEEQKHIEELTDAWLKSR